MTAQVHPPQACKLPIIKVNSDFLSVHTANSTTPTSLTASPGTATSSTDAVSASAFSPVSALSNLSEGSAKRDALQEVVSMTYNPLYPDGWDCDCSSDEGMSEADGEDSEGTFCHEEGNVEGQGLLQGVVGMATETQTDEDGMECVDSVLDEVLIEVIDEAGVEVAKAELAAASAVAEGVVDRLLVEVLDDLQQEQAAAQELAVASAADAIVSHVLEGVLDGLQAQQAATKAAAHRAACIAAAEHCVADLIGQALYTVGEEKRAAAAQAEEAALDAAADAVVARVLQDVVHDMQMEQAAAAQAEEAALNTAADTLAESVVEQALQEVMFEEEVADVASSLVDDVVEDFEDLQSKMRAQAKSIMQTCNLGLLLSSVQCNAEAFLLRVGA